MLKNACYTWIWKRHVWNMTNNNIIQKDQHGRLTEGGICSKITWGFSVGWHLFICLVSPGELKNELAQYLHLYMSLFCTRTLLSNVKLVGQTLQSLIFDMLLFCGSLYTLVVCWSLAWFSTCFRKYAWRLNVFPQVSQWYWPSSDGEFRRSPGVIDNICLFKFNGFELSKFPSWFKFTFAGNILDGTLCLLGKDCLGLCHRRCEAKLAGQLKTLSHSGHLYSTWTIRGQRCCANLNASS
jgi:hypothetical protein